MAGPRARLACHLPRQTSVNGSASRPTIFIDDIDGSEAEGTVLFGLDGTQYETALSADHAK